MMHIIVRSEQARSIFEINSVVDRVFPFEFDRRGHGPR
jgi:hypothetical protein